MNPMETRELDELIVKIRDEEKKIDSADRA